MSYLNFDLEIGAGSARKYPVTVLHSAAGEARETMHFPFDDLLLENQLLSLQNVLLRSGGQHRLILSPDERIVQNFGRTLFDALFVGEVRSSYAVNKREAMLQGKGLRVRLRILTPKLAALPWEFMYDVNQAEYLCLSCNTPIVRYLELPQPPQPLPVAPPLSILGMTASPKGLSPLDIEREKLRLEKALARLRANGWVKLTWLTGQTWQDLQRAMRRGQWHIFHFIGHGGFNPYTDEGLIALEDDDGQEYRMSATNLGRLLTDHRSLRLVVLNACEGARGSEQDIFSSTASILTRRGIPAVLAMQYEITDRAAIELSRAFYEALADGTSVDMAVSEARKAISLAVANTVEWGTPVLYMRSSDGNLFDLNQSLQQEQLDMHPSTEIPQGASSTVLQEADTKRTRDDETYHSAPKSIEQLGQLEQSGIATMPQPLLPPPLPTEPYSPEERVKIFVCYAREDELLLKELARHLSVLQRQGLLDLWSDRNIHAGTEWEHEINLHLSTAQIILLLISPDFINSDFCYSKEMKRALERHKQGEAFVIPIILRPVYWQNTPFSTLQVLPREGQPITNWVSRDEAFFNVADGIRQVAQQTLTSSPLTNQPPLLEVPSSKKDIDVSLYYAHTDEQFKQQLEKHLRALVRQGYISCQHNYDISIEIEGEQQSDLRLDSSQIILLLISPDFMDSDFCYSREMKQVLERHEQGEISVVPIILRPVYWEGAPFSKLQVLPKNATPVTSPIWSNTDEAFLNVVEGISKAIRLLANNHS